MTSKGDRAYRTFVRCRHLVREARDERRLFEDICRTAVDQLGFRMAWVGLVTDGDSTVHPVAQAGFEEGYLAAVHITHGDDAFGQGPTGRAIRLGQPQVSQDIATDARFAPWRADAIRRGYASSAALPLHDGARTLGALNLYASEPDAFGDGELALLEEVALDVVLGIERLRLQQTLDRVTTRLDEALRVQAAALAATTLAHDLNNLLQVVSNALEVAAARPKEEAASAIEDAGIAIQSMAALSRKLLSLTRRTADHDEWASPDHVIRGSATLLTRLARGCTLELDLHGDSIHVPLGSTDLERILINLVVNAAHAMPRGGRLTVGSETRELGRETPTDSGPLAPGTYVVLTVQDEGVGIPPALLPHVLEPLFTTRPDGGSGLGLASVVAIVGPSGGGVSVDSRVGRGTRVSVFLPARRGSPRPT